jgi:hypothetical protein
VHSARIGILTGRYAHGALKCSFELMGAHTGWTAKSGKSYPCIAGGVFSKTSGEAGIDFSANACDSLDSRIGEMGATWLAAAAGPESQLLGGFG